jgi:DNA-binding transcriptional ArsR family regulator
MTASDDDPGRLARLERLLEQVSSRLTALEQGEPAAPPPGRPAALTGSGPGEAGLPAGPGGETAELTYAGRGWFGPNRVRIRVRAGLSDVLQADAEPIAKIFAALASPARVTLLRALLNGPRTSQQLRGDLDDASVGQLYHHLKELLAAGLVIQPGRSLYAVPRGSEVAICVQILAAAQLMPVGRPYPVAEPALLDDGATSGQGDEFRGGQDSQRP